MQLQKSTASTLLLGMGNSKLGDLIHTFTLPAIDTCPGRSKLCEKACYALKGQLLMQHIVGRYKVRYEASLKDDFADRVISEIRLRGCQVVRIHVAGDFYSPEYVAKWATIVAACPKTRFFVYSRSWRVPAIRKQLNLLARLPNIRVWFSCDRETGIPPKVSRRVRIAYMAMDNDDKPSRTPDLGFRVVRKGVRKRVSGAIVCPTENGADAEVTCQKCGLCWEPLEAKDPRRFALPLA
jgi:hypothetical protein